jgi:hypothetical protein
MTDQLNMMTLYYATASTMISNRMLNAGRDPTWNAPQWDVRTEGASGWSLRSGVFPPPLRGRVREGG